jgi:hypothetical protein
MCTKSTKDAARSCTCPLAHQCKRQKGTLQTNFEGALNDTASLHSFLPPQVVLSNNLTTENDAQKGHHS